MPHALAGLAALGLAATLGRGRGDDGLGAALPQNVLCFFELFEGQSSNVKNGWGSPIPGSCDRKAGGSVAAKRKQMKKYAGRRGDPSIACKFPVLATYKGIALGVARNCRRV